MAPLDSSPTSPSGAQATMDSTTTNNVLSDLSLSESPISSPNSTPVRRVSGTYRVESDEAVPPLRLDDIQSAVPFDGAPDSNESEYIISKPLAQGD